MKLNAMLSLVSCGETELFGSVNDKMTLQEHFNFFMNSFYFRERGAKTIYSSSGMHNL